MKAEPQTRDDLREGHYLHHRAYCSEYVSRKIDCVIRPYNGRFGKGYTLRYNDSTRSKYTLGGSCLVEYWIRHGGEKKTIYTNISDDWGEMTQATVADYKKMAGIYGVEVEITSDENGIYINDVQVATADR